MKIDTSLQLERFADIDINDPFFDTLKSAYQEFPEWFRRKASEKAFIIKDEIGFIQGFVYLKEENGAIQDINPSLPCDRYLKIGTFKVNAHGTKLGERFVKKAFDLAISKNIKKLYVTIFSEHKPLINLFCRYGFKAVAKKTTQNGIENVFLKEIGHISKDVDLDYPIISLSQNQYLLSIYPKYHTRLFPDSILNNEQASIVDDVSHTNSIGKIYICKMDGAKLLKSGDALVIYRTGDGLGPALYRSVATSLCMVEEMKTKSSFGSLEEFLKYCLSRSVFTEEELTNFYRSWNQFYVIKMTYNAALKNRIIRQKLIEEVKLNPNAYWGLMKLSPNEFSKISMLGDVDDSLILN
ncbi:MAG: hypothetical protein KME47_17145 [Nodosilinea sp. WJT8-NPBG4]|jgi:hypothetical protein|nr:hypothetical protein [Nodosilinea sp. WJT8-NPBG4]